MRFRPIRESVANKEIEYALTARTYRPIVMCAIFQIASKNQLNVLAIKNSHGDAWSLVQGGIEAADRSISDAAQREIREEVLPDPDDIELTIPLREKPGWVTRAKIVKPQPPRGFRRGCLYVPTLSIASSQAVPVAQRPEIVDAVFMPVEEFNAELSSAAHTRPTNLNERNAQVMDLALQQVATLIH